MQAVEGAAPEELEQRPLTRALLDPTAAYVLLAGAHALEACREGSCEPLSPSWHGLLEVNMPKTRLTLWG